MRTITCKHCGTHNGYKSHFCEACGKKVSRGSQSDGIFVLVFIFCVVLFAVFAYSKGYRLSHIPAILAQMK